MRRTKTGQTSPPSVAAAARQTRNFAPAESRHSLGCPQGACGAGRGAQPLSRRQGHEGAAVCVAAARVAQPRCQRSLAPSSLAQQSDVAALGLQLCGEAEIIVPADEFESSAELY
jgi:hypothetical protein